MGYGLHGWDSPDYRARNRGCSEHSDTGVNSKRKESQSSSSIELGLEVEALEEPLYVSSPLGTRARLRMICRGCELKISRTLLTVDPEDHGHVRVRCHLGDGLANSLQGRYRL